jgi:cystathionine gamma-synthase
VRLYARDLAVLARNAEGFTQRVAGANRNGEAVAAFLASHPAVARVWHPSLVDRAHYDALRSEHGGYGGLLSFALVQPERAPAVYEAMRFCKGPSLGTEYSLICPYTLLAHYTELEWAAACGVPRDLLRLSVGLEPLAEILDRLAAGLEEA